MGAPELPKVLHFAPRIASVLIQLGKATWPLARRLAVASGLPVSEADS